MTLAERIPHRLGMPGRSAGFGIVEASTLAVASAVTASASRRVIVRPAS
jgi:hypothetical protein